MLIEKAKAQDWWEEAVQELREKAGEYLFNMWFSKLSCKESTQGQVTLFVPTALHAQRLNSAPFAALIKEVISRFNPHVQEITFEIAETEPQEQLFEVPIPTPIIERHIPSPEARRSSRPLFKLEFTFSSFVQGDSNEFALKLCRNVSESPGEKQLNPLVIYGKTGLGKTHLLHALGQQAWELKSADSIRLSCSAELMNEFATAARNKDIQKLFNNYKKHDLILIDDVQFIAGTKWMEERFTELIQTLRSHKKQVVLICDQPIQNLHWLHDSSPREFEHGMAAGIDLPDAALRLEILRSKMSASDVLSEEVLEFVAENFSSNIRELEGVLLKLLAHQEFFTSETNVEIAASILSDNFRDQSQSLTLEMIAAEVAHAFGVTSDHLKSTSRKKEFTLPRKVAMHLSSTMLDLTLHSIGIFFNRDYSTVHASLQSLAKLLRRDADLSDRIEQLRERLLQIKKQA